MKLLRVHLKEYADSMVYPSKRLLSKEDPTWTEEPREGEQRHGPYELEADYERQVVWVNRVDAVPFALVAFMRHDGHPAAVPWWAQARDTAAEAAGDALVFGTGVMRVTKEPGRAGTIPVSAECDKCGEKFDTPQKLGGHKRHCKGRVQ